MPLLQTVSRLFRRRSRPVRIDLTGTQAEPLGNPPAKATAGKGEASRSDKNFAHDTAADIRHVEPKPSAIRRQTESALQQEEVMSLVRRIGEHLDSQSERTERMMTLMGRMPQALDALPEINRQNTTLLDALHDQFGQSKTRDDALNATLASLSDASDRQTEVLGLVHQDIDSSSRSTENLATTLDALREALTDMARANARSAEVLAQLAKNSNAREAELVRVITRAQRWMIGGIFFCGCASIAALIVAILAMTGG